VWLFNIISINNLLLFVLLLVMFLYFLIRGEKNREMFSLLVFIFMLLVWQLVLLFQNVLFHPLSAYPVFYFLNSGFTLLGYLGLVMFSYHYIKPVFELEMRVMFVLMLVLIFAFLLHALIIEFPRHLAVTFNPDSDIYVLKESPLRKYIVLMLLIQSGIIAKNFIYKAIILKGEMRAYLAKISLCIITGLLLLPLTFVMVRLFRIDENIANTILTFYTSIVIIYTLWSYFEYARIRFKYSDKTRLIILFLIIISISITSSFTFQSYRRAYYHSLESTFRQVMFDVAGGQGNPAYYASRYGGQAEYITARDVATGRERYLLGSQPQFLMFYAEVPPGIVRHDVRLQGKKVSLFFTGRSGTSIVQAGFSYLDYRRYTHGFVSIGFFTSLGIILVVYFMLRFMVSISLINPLRGLLGGIEEIQKGNLDHRIPATDLDEIGYIAQEFNHMISDLQERNDEIQRSEKKYRELMTLLPDIIYETDTDLNITFFNEAGYRLTGFGADDIARGLPMETIMHRDDFLVLKRMLFRQSDSTTISIFTHRVMRKDGSFFSGENNAAIVRSKDGVIGIRGVIRDVTEKMRLEQRLIQSQKMEIIGSLAGGIAHDFNNILGGIIGSISLLEYKLKGRESYPREEIDDDIGILKISAERAMKMVEQILGISRRQRLSMEVTDLGRVVGHVREICKNTFDKKIVLDFRDDAGGGFIVLGDATQLEQVLLNLCINAHDAMTIMRPESEEYRGTLSVSLTRVLTDADFRALYPDAKEPEYICIRVRDTGVGMDDYTMERVFDPFFTTKDKNRGTGLGLAMVYNIVKQHGGIIDVYSEPGTGTSFTVFIPAAAAGTTVPAAPPDHTAKHGDGGLILMIEDDPAIQKTCEKILRVLGYDVIIAEDGQRGVELFRERHGDVKAIILDMVMPRRSGKETFVEIKKIEPDVIVLVSSGFRNDARIDDVLRMGAQGFLQKPYTINQLAEELGKIIPPRTA
jgi:PAS domain S-box-containing protein